MTFLAIHCMYLVRFLVIFLFNNILFIELIDILRSIKSIIGNDIMLLVILLVLVLFAPDGPHVVAREVISNIQVS